MKKTMILIAAFAILFTSLSAAVDDRRVAAYGKEAPAVVVERHGASQALEAMRGKWVVLSFWSTTDPVSRLTQNKIASIVKSGNGDNSDGNRGDDAEIEFKTPAGVYSLGNKTKVEVLSVNFDQSEPLMNEIVSIDNLLESSQTRVKSKEEIKRLCDAFEMNNGLRAFIIDPEGKLVMADPDEDTLRMLLASI
ncbi:MAG: hypothetical protein K2I61_04965 [Muribaculaceae bacterium]|nr:hypothetical protein [Muribaculaceae bacterium]